MGPRDGLQNENVQISTEIKLAFISALANSGLKEIEATSFVSPKWVPQLGDAFELWGQLPPGPLYSCLVPNQRGLHRALEAAAERIAVFTAVTDEFCEHNLNMSVDESLAVFGEVVSEFRGQVPDGWVRGYLSTSFECPYSGRVNPERTAAALIRLFDLGVDEVSIGDTVGKAGPKEVAALCSEISAVDKGKVVWHFHDTYGTAVANTAMALQHGYLAFDASAGGLGGCPYSPGAGGNLSTDDLVYFLERSGVPTGVDREKLAHASEVIFQALGRSPASKAQVATLACSP